MSKEIEFSVTQDLIISGMFISVLFHFFEILQNLIDSTFSPVHMWKLTVIFFVLSIELIYIFLKKTYKQLSWLEIEFILTTSIMIECVINLINFLSNFGFLTISFGKIVIIVIQIVSLVVSVVIFQSIFSWDIIVENREGKEIKVYFLKKKS